MDLMVLLRERRNSQLNPNLELKKTDSEDQRRATIGRQPNVSPLNDIKETISRQSKTESNVSKEGE